MKFICDVMLGKLAKYLRLLGFDAVYAPNRASLEHYAQNSGDRLFLTRRKEAIGFPTTLHLTSEKTREQLVEMRDLIRSAIEPGRVLSRCSRCNVELIEVERTEIETRVPEFVFHNYVRFKTCPFCRRVYWEGSHAKGMENLIKEILS